MSDGQYLITFLIRNSLLITGIYLLVLYASVWHCMGTETGTSRIAWVIVIIFLPIGGIPLYAMHTWSKPILEEGQRPQDPDTTSARLP